jgi:transposase
LLAAKFRAVFPHLDERQRRLLAGAEARALGHGGIRAVAKATGMREGTVSRGVVEVDSGQQPLGRARRPGGGRKKAADANPDLRPALMALVQPDVRGDPTSPLRWTTESTRKLADELTRAGHKVSADTVGDLLREEGFSLRGNVNSIEGSQHRDRAAQFHYINERAKHYQAAGDPVVNVDTKKKELVGQYKNAGRQWRREADPVEVQTHDFPDQDLGKDIPYGNYDLAANTGWVGVGTDHDTAAFAVACLRRWWDAVGRAAYPHSRRLLVTADAGGKGYRIRAWKAELAALAVETGLEITVCHLPPGTYKCNKIEHRLYSHITMNWRGRPLSSHEVAVNSMAATTTRAGLTAAAELDTDTYATGVRVSDEQMEALPLGRHEWHGDWNYTLHPKAYPRIPVAGPDPFEQLNPDIGWLCHPAVTGLTAPEWDALIATITMLQQEQREAELDKRRAHRPRKTRSGTGRRPSLTLADRLLATVLHHRLALPHVAVAALFSIRPETSNRWIRDTRRLLQQAGRTIQPADTPLSGLDDLYDFATTAGLAVPPRITTAS